MDYCRNWILYVHWTEFMCGNKHKFIYWTRFFYTILHICVPGTGRYLNVIFGHVWYDRDAWQFRIPLEAPALWTLHWQKSWEFSKWVILSKVFFFSNRQIIRRFENKITSLENIRILEKMTNFENIFVSLRTGNNDGKTRRKGLHFSQN